MFWIAALWVSGVTLAAIFAPLLPLRDPNEIDISARLAPPLSSGLLLGGDGLGRDLLSRAVFGARVSLGISVGAVVLGLGLGTLIGLLVGFFRGWVDGAIMPIVDVMLAFPALVLILAVVAFIGPSVPGLILVLAILAIPSSVRIVRANTLGAASRGWVLSARAEGAGPMRIIFKEVAPSLVPQLTTLALLGVGIYIVVEGGLGYLGLSVQPPTPTWGSMIVDGQSLLRDSIWPTLVPALALFLTVLSLNYIGDVLRRRWDVKESSL